MNKYLIIHLVFFLLTGCSASEITSVQGTESQSRFCDQDLINAWKQKSYRLSEFKRFVVKSESDQKFFHKILDLHRKGDTIWYYCSPSETWEKLMGRSGYALFRNGKLIIKIDTVIN